MQKQTTAIICLSPYGGGMELDAVRLGKKLSPFMPIVLIAKRDHFIDKQKGEYEGYNGIKLETIQFKANLSLSIFFNARRIVKKYNIKNVIFFGASELKSLYFSFLGLDINLSVRHGTTKSKPKKDWFHRLIYSDVNTHIAICQHLEENIKYIVPFGKNTQSKLIYSSFEVDKPCPQEHKKLTLAHVGRIVYGKGQEDAIKACDILVKNDIDFDFYIIGGFDEKYEKNFNEFLESVPYKEHIKLVGLTNDVKRYLNRSDIFLFPSYGEGLANAFIEALSYNLVCISYNNTSFPELNDLGFCFKMCEDRDIDSVRRILLEVATNLDDCKACVKENHTLAETIFPLEKELENYFEILK
jgi:glycosyltransferase involved in cell wall biosynthesis